MSQKQYLKRHLKIAFIVMIVELLVLFFTFSFLQNIFTHPDRFFSLNVSVEQAQFDVLIVSWIITSVLISYIMYLLAASRSRAELIATVRTNYLGESLDQFKRIYESAPIPYITLDQKGTIIEPNKAALRFFGVVPEEIIGKSIFTFTDKEDAQRSDLLHEYYTRNVPINREEIHMMTKSGEVRWVLLSVFEMRNPATLMRTGLATLFDITEQKQLDQSKTEFVSLASHQLRTPLATIKWYTDMMLSGGTGELLPKQKEYIERLYTVNEDMIDLVDTLLNVSRIEIGKLPIEKKSISVKDLVENILIELTSQIEKKKIKIVKEYNDALTAVESDPKLLRIVIQNLISNSIKYTPDEGQVTITFKESAGESTIAVADTGHGIPKEAQSKVFTKLFRADNVKTLSSSQGTGLGLYLVKSIIEALGGSISFISEENKGSTFTIKL